MSEKFKQVIILREDIEMSKGKQISQACHASLEAYKKSDKDSISKWESTGSKKIVLSSGNQKMEDLYSRMERNDIPAYLVKDAGKTEVKPGTITAIGAGPTKESKINEITGELQLIG